MFALAACEFICEFTVLNGAKGLITLPIVGLPMEVKDCWVSEEPIFPCDLLTVAGEGDDELPPTSRDELLGSV